MNDAEDLVYLASPYSHPDPAVMEWRAEAATAAAAAMMRTGVAVFAPIPHSHAIGKALGTSTDFDFWMAQDLPVLRRCSRLAVLMLHGWESSRGVTREIEEATRCGIPVEYLEPAERFPPLPAPASNKPSNPKDAVGIRKAALSCVPLGVIAEIGVGMMEGAAKYGRHNYRAVGVRSSVYFDAAVRHLFAYWEGEDLDPDSGMPHLAKLLTTVVVWRDAQMQGKCTDDRPPPSVPFYSGMNAAAAAIVDRYADRTPKHWTIADAEPIGCAPPIR